MTTTRKVTRKKGAPKLGSLASVLAQFVTLKKECDDLAKRRDNLKKELCAAVEADGYTDDKGSLYLDLEEEVQVNGKTYGGMKWERRVSQPINPDRAESLVKRKKLADRCIVLVPTLDEDELLKAHYEGLITQEELDSVIDFRETYAFKPIEL